MSIPKTMKAAVLFNFGDLRVTEVPVPSLGAGEALVKVHSVAICGSDPAIIAKGWKGYPKLGEFIPGHEFTGTVVAVAPDVTELKEGDRMAVEPHKGCGRCENCIRGLYTTCLNYGTVIMVSAPTAVMQSTQRATSIPCIKFPIASHSNTAPC